METAGGSYKQNGITVGEKVSMVLLQYKYAYGYTFCLDAFYLCTYVNR